MLLNECVGLKCQNTEFCTHDQNRVEFYTTLRYKIAHTFSINAVFYPVSVELGDITCS